MRRPFHKMHGLGNDFVIVAARDEPFEVTPALAADRTLSVEGSFHYQACDDKECYLPKTIPLNWTFKLGQLDTQRVPDNLQRKAPSR